MKKKIIIILFLLFTGLSLNAQNQEIDKPVLFLGPYLGYNLNVHFPLFGEFPGYPSCCSQYDKGSGSGFSFGGSLTVPIVESLELNFRVGFSDIGGSFSKPELIGGVFYTNPKTNMVTDSSAYVDHKIDKKLFMINLEPTIVMKYFKHVALSVGFKMGYFLTNKFDQVEQITSPDNLTFSNGSRQRNQFANQQIPDIRKLQFFGLLGAAYEFEIKKDWYLSPEIRYYVPFMDITSSVGWMASTYQFGASLKIPIYPPPPPPPPKPIIIDTLIKRDTTTITEIGLKETEIQLVDTQKDIKTREDEDAIYETTIYSEKYKRTDYKPAGLSSSVTAIGLTKDGKKQDKPAIIIEETEVEEGFPLLPHIFFPSGGSDLTQSGLKILTPEEARNFKENKLPWQTLEIYSEMLNIIGARLKANPKASITVTGCNSNSDAEKNNQKLSIDRANVVRDYLINTFAVSPPQIKVKRQNLPANPSNITVDDGRIENQRAEISSDNFDIMKPVYLKEIQKTSNPPVINIYPVVNSEAGIKSYDLSIEQNGNNIRSFKGEELTQVYQWNVEDEPLPKYESDIDIKLTAIDALSQKVVADTKLSIKQLTISHKRYELKDDKRIEKFSLILFDYDKADLTLFQQTVLQDIKKRILPNSKVIISGYTDRIGEKDYNRDLAKKRCTETQKILNVPVNNLVTHPIGSDELLYSNDTPQGRSYCRTVKIEIETPVKE